MRHIIGIDVASEVSSVVVMTSSGRVVMNTRIHTTEKNLKSLVKSVKGPSKVVFEECGQAAWLYSVLEPVCEEVFVCNPKKNRDLSGHSKSDDNDALNLAERARLGGLTRVWHGGKSLQALRERARDYQALTSDSTAVKNRIKAVFRNRGISVGVKAYEPLSREEAVRSLPNEALRTRVHHLGEVLDVISEQREDAKRLLVETAKKSSMYKSLISIPKIGEIFSSYILAEVGTAHRFRTRQQFWSYAGLAITTFDTGQYRVDEHGMVQRKRQQARTKGLVREYNRSLKYVFKHVAMDLSHHEWQREYQRLQQSGVSPENARLTLARKVAAIVLRVMKTGELYNEALVFPHQ